MTRVKESFLAEKEFLGLSAKVVEYVVKKIEEHKKN